MHNDSVPDWTGEWAGTTKKVYELAYSMATNLYVVGGPFRAGCNVTSALVQNRPWHGTFVIEFMATVPESLRHVTQALVNAWRFINAFDQVIWDVEPLLAWIRPAYDVVGVSIPIPQTYQLKFDPVQHYSRTEQSVTFKNLKSWTAQVESAYKVAYAKTIGIYNATSQSIISDYLDYSGGEQTLLANQRTAADPNSQVTINFVSMVTVAYKDRVRQVIDTAGRAVDGVAHVSLNLNACTMTQWSANPWWRVDMQQATYVRRVVVRNRNDALSSELTDFEVRVGLSTQVLQNAKCGHTDGQNLEAVPRDPPEPTWVAAILHLILHRDRPRCTPRTPKKSYSRPTATATPWSRAG